MYVYIESERDELEQLRWFFAQLQMRATPKGAEILYRAYVHLCTASSRQTVDAGEEL
jgi:hypothetical protein